MVAGIPDQAGHDAVAVQGRAEIVGADEEILAPLLLGEHMARSSGVKLERPREKIGRLRQDVMVAADPDNPSDPLEFMESSGHLRKGCGRQTQGAGDGGGRHGLLADQSQDPVLEFPLLRSACPGHSNLLAGFFAAGLRLGTGGGGCLGLSAEIRPNGTALGVLGHASPSASFGRGQTRKCLSRPMRGRDFPDEIPLF